MAIDNLSTNLDQLFAASTADRTSFRSADVRALQHFYAETALTLGPLALVPVIQQLTLPNAWYDPALMHLALAVSTAHQQRLHCRSNDHSVLSSLRLSAAHHWQSALAIQRTQLAKTDASQNLGISVLKLSLIVIFTFALDDVLPVNTFLDGNAEMINHAIAPLAACNGFRAFKPSSDRLIALDQGSPAASVLTSADDSDHTFTDVQPGVEGLPPTFVKLCDLDSNSTCENNVYHKIVRLLTPLLRLTPSPNNFVRLMAFGGRIWLDIQPLLQRRDHAALLLVAYWLALLRQVNQWWILTRARTACDAIVNYLLQNSTDTLLHSVLLFPATFGQQGVDRVWVSGR
ncbi:hypothetical protein LTR62_002559 [Meristemomyces frigidus]|uniref:Uncharacterized protein n=1 Tax=Meristemomyces frigidus TaxID=1508187 RepID=A0AAN7TFZ2_9PEZI|nr:hypothetical protein LTR62_002559 [Meristemomyces frigidus]